MKGDALLLTAGGALSAIDAKHLLQLHNPFKASSQVVVRVVMDHEFFFFFSALLGLIIIGL